MLSWCSDYDPNSSSITVTPPNLTNAGQAASWPNRGNAYKKNDRSFWLRSFDFSRDSAITQLTCLIKDDQPKRGSTCLRCWMEPCKAKHSAMQHH